MVKWDRSKGSPEPIKALNRVCERENGEPLVDLVSVAPEIVPAREQVIPYVRERVALMCREAAHRLPKGVRLGLVEGWRPLARQQRIWDFVWRCAQEAFPHRDHRALRRTVCRWVAPTDQTAPPGHCTGGAVDVWLLSESGEPVDVSAPFDRYGAAPTYAFGLHPEAQRMRMILVEAMLGAGFSNCRDEWWHYSFGDAGWAVRTGHLECCYGLATLPPNLYERLEAAHAESMKERPNPFLRR